MTNRITEAFVNGTKEKIIITNDYEDSEFYKKIKKNYPHSVLEYLAIKNYDYKEILDYINNNNNVSLTLHNFKPKSPGQSFKILSKFKIEGTTLINLDAKNSNDKKFKLDLDSLNLDNKIISRTNYPFYAIVDLNKLESQDDKKVSSILATNIEFLEAINIDIEEYKNLRKEYSTQEWLNLILNTIGYDGDTLTPFEKYSFLVRLIPFCINHYHSIELGNKETAKSYFYSIMPGIYSSSVSSGDISMAQFVNNDKDHTPGILQTTNVVNFDEVTDMNLKDKRIMSLLQEYLQDGQASKGSTTFYGKASIAFTGNIKDFENSVLNKESLFEQFKDSSQNETIFNKLHFFIPGWKSTKINPNKYAKKESTKIRRDYFLCVLNLMREISQEYLDEFKDKIEFKNTESGRDLRITATIAGLIMLLHPDKEISSEELEAFAYIALIGRKSILREIEILNEREHSNLLAVKNVETNKKINFEVLSNFILNTSETLLNSHNISLDNIEYYYLDYYKNYDITNEINRQYDFELIEPTIVIKCAHSPKLYKLAISSYGINMNILEVFESRKSNIDKKSNIICNNLTENFMLIETNQIKANVEKLYLKKFLKSTNTIDTLKEKYKDEESITSILEFLKINQENQSNLSNTVKKLENQLTSQNIKLIESQKTIDKMNYNIKIKDTVNLIFSIHSTFLDELYHLRKIILDEIDDSFNEYISTSRYRRRSRYFYGNKKYRDYDGEYRYLYKKFYDDEFPYDLVGKIYLETDTIFKLKNKKIKNTSHSIKDKTIDKELRNYILDIDIILNIDVDEVKTFSYLYSNFEDKYLLDKSLENLKELINNLENLINNFSEIRTLLKKLNYKPVFSNTEIDKYLNLLKELSKNSEYYMINFLNPNKQEPNVIYTSNILENTIFDNKFVKKYLKNSQN